MNRFNKTSSGTLHCPICSSTSIKLIERIGQRGPYYVTRWQCKECARNDIKSTFRYEQLPNPEKHHNDKDKFWATFNPYRSFKRGLKIIHPKLEI